MTSSSRIVRLRTAEGLLAGIVLGLVHSGILATAGLYVMQDAAVVLGSAARYAALFGVVGGVVGLLTGLVCLLGPLRRIGPGLGVWAMLVVYVSPWLALLVKDRYGNRALLAAAVAGVVIALVAVAALWRRSARRSEPRTGLRAPRTMAVVGLFALCGILYAAPHLSGESTPVSDTDPRAPSALAGARSDATGVFTRKAEGFPAGRWNLLLLTIDTLRADHLGCYGYERETSPSLDALARSGMRFDRAHCQRPKTSPSFATILTGTYPASHGVHTTMSVLADRNLTLAEYLRGAGYVTAAVITNGNLYPVFSFDQGFDTYIYGHKDARTGADSTLAWLERNADAEPWFMWVHFTDPHMPYGSAPAPYPSLFTEGTMTPLERMIALYDGDIRFADDGMGRILTWLDEHGLSERTLVVFTADHGESLGEHDYYFEHGLHPYEPSARIPLILSAPGVISPGTSYDGLVSTVDLMPTVLDALELDTPETLQGRSVLAAATGLSTGEPQDFVYIEAGYGPHHPAGRTRAIRRRDTKYIHRLTGWALRPRDPLAALWSYDSRFEGAVASDELYDLAADPGETRNLIRERPVEAERDRIALRRFGAWLAADAMQNAEESPALDSQVREALRSLGYIN